VRTFLVDVEDRRVLPVGCAFRVLVGVPDAASGGEGQRHDQSGAME
jgi:hypothetical protein